MLSQMPGLQEVPQDCRQLGAFLMAKMAHMVGGACRESKNSDSRVVNQIKIQIINDSRIFLDSRIFVK